MEESSSDPVPVQDDLCALPKVGTFPIAPATKVLFPGKTKHCNHQGVSDSAYVLSSREESQVQFREKSLDNIFSPGETVHSQQQNLPGQPLQ